MTHDQLMFNINAYKSNNQILDLANFLVYEFGLDHPNLEGFGFRDELEKNSILLTANGDIGERQMVMIPRNLFDFDFNLVINMLAHEMLHVRQKSPEVKLEDKNEREWQAYNEMLFHTNFPNVPDVSDYHKKFFGEKALEYYKRMGDGSVLQLKYAEEKERLLDFLKVLDNTEKIIGPK
ncbi:hypothetical protein G6R40_09305 [Chryseobacterium sp. POL2]|uniref:hypothetical protein n=1 Tax=Chryseobacterium sp. POL2 TaxID=2713414 RepID=UPI0013E18306|nr:hypothetical protein [Chryseobacterium sp. POL2]QIG89848.1 hypothetical protein G6R40_09305 [Chryseobacterium sp. POL2]